MKCFGYNKKSIIFVYQLKNKSYEKRFFRQNVRFEQITF